MSPPRIHEILFAAVLIWLFATGQGWSVLLADGDSGWHIRNGEQIIDTRSVPHSDSFSFDSAGHPWFSWEWLSDVLFAALYRKGGLRAVAVLCGIVIALSVSVLFRHMIWRSVGVCIALPLTLLSVGASSVHYLARPHVLGLLFFAIACWVIDRDRASPDRRIWYLPGLFLVWANCHGSFLAGIAMLGLWMVEALTRLWNISGAPGWNSWRRPALLFAACSGATLVNPYGWHLHAHAVEFLRSSWIQANVEEFQSPRFRSENMLQYEVLMIAGLSALPWLLRRRDYYPSLVILLWVHESLTSVRHVPLYCLAGCPFIASWLDSIWKRGVRRCGAGSLFSAFQSINLTWNCWNRGFTVWPLILCIYLATSSTHQDSRHVRVTFPENKFPVRLIERNLASFGAGGARPLRVFSSDQWSDYLIFRCHPGIRIFFDGRSDFFGPWRGKSYRQLMAGTADSAAILDHEQVAVALIPADWALAGILQSCTRWRIADRDEHAVLFVREQQEVSASCNQKPREDR